MSIPQGLKVCLPTSVKISNVITHFHNFCNSSIKGAVYVSIYASLTDSFPWMIIYNITKKIFVTNHGNRLYMSNKTSYVECLRLNSPNGFIPFVAKAKQRFLRSFIKFGHIASMCFHAFESTIDQTMPFFNDFFHAIAQAKLCSCTNTSSSSKG